MQITSHPAPSRATRPRLGLGRKAAALFLVVFVALAAMTAIGAIQLRAVGLDARRFLEESHEARLAHDMEAEVEQLQLLARMGERADAPGFIGQTLVLISTQLERLATTERSGDDEAALAHEAREQATFDDIRAALELLTRQAEAGYALDPETLWQLQEGASSVRGKTDEEVASATADLTLRVTRLAEVFGAMLLIVLLGLGAMFYLTRRHVVEPLRELSTGARAFGEGDLDRRIDAPSRDEIGVLASEFNRMADSLTSTQRHLEERVRQRTAELIRTARLADLGTFAAGVAHEVNTPLASIASCAEGLQRRIAAGTMTAEQQSEYLQTIAREAYRARDITARLLAMGRREPGARAPMDLVAAIGNVARLMEHDLADRGLRLLVEIEEPAPALTGSPGEIEQVLLNLIKNAADASPRDEAIVLRARQEGEQVVLEVEDRGPGVPEAERERIFEPFFTTKRPGEGTGLGLSIVHGIVQGHHGSIEVDEAPGGGALLRVRLPGVPAAPGAVA